MKTLIVEDEKSTAIIIEKIAQACNLETQIADSTELAITKLELGENPEILIIDYHLPGKNGAELCKWIRSQAFGKNTFLLIATQDSSWETYKEVKAMGADDFLLKPIDPTALQLRLELTIRKIKSQNEEFTIPFGLNCFLFVPEVWTFENHMQYTLAPNTRCTISCPIDNKHSLLQILGTETPVPNQTHFVAKNTDLLKILTHPNTPAV